MPKITYVQFVIFCVVVFLFGAIGVIIKSFIFDDEEGRVWLGDMCFPCGGIDNNTECLCALPYHSNDTAVKKNDQSSCNFHEICLEASHFTKEGVVSNFSEIESNYSYNRPCHHTCMVEGRPFRNIEDTNQISNNYQQQDQKPVVAMLENCEERNNEWTMDDILSIRANENNILKMKDWGSAMLAEHASIATFSRLSLDLLAVAAPPMLISQTLDAAQDEIRHAMICASLNELEKGHDSSIKPGKFPFHRNLVHIRPDLITIVEEGLRDGLFGEGGAALDLFKLAMQFKEAGDDQISLIVSEMARDEIRHAEIGYNIAAWAMQSFYDKKLSSHKGIDLKWLNVTDTVEKAIKLGRQSFKALSSFNEQDGIILEWLQDRAKDLLRSSDTENKINFSDTLWKMFAINYSENYKYNAKES